MTVMTDVITTLNGYAGLTALVSNRNYSQIMPQTPTFPNTVSTRTGTRVENDLDGLGRENPTIQIDCRAVTYQAARNVAEQVKLAMQNATLFKSLLTNDADFPYQDNAEVYRVSLDFSIW